jgi:hypothetical protein
MGWHKDRSYVLDNIGVEPKYLRTPEEEVRIRRNRSPGQRALDRKMEADFRARRAVFTKFAKKKGKTLKKGKT